EGAPPAEGPVGEERPAAEREVQAPEVAAVAEREPAAAEPEPDSKAVLPRWLSIGSADPASNYRMLVIFNNRGAAMERVGLNGPRYRDLEDRSGFLGYLAAVDAPKRSGAMVLVVGAGTPAEKAGLMPSDVIQAIGDSPISTAADLL